VCYSLGPIAQLVEQRTFNPWVDGSSPSGPTSITYTEHMKSQTWLITGGAGYIGAHVADLFLANNKEIIVFDQVKEEQSSRIQYLKNKYKKNIPFITGDVRDAFALDQLLSGLAPDGVIHTAALKSVSESIEHPSEYHDVNFKATSQLLELLKKHKIRKFIFSSTAAVYGSPLKNLAVKESDFVNPISPYGSSKLAAEEEVNKFLSLKENCGTSLRFFNVIGSASPSMIDTSVANLVPIVKNALDHGYSPVIFGGDFPTEDGTCVRDYVDVRDIATAHLIIADSNNKMPRALNVGTGRGASVRQVIDLICDVAKRKDIDPQVLDRRAGDPAFLCADVELIRETIGFNAKYSLKESIGSLYMDSK
jgi:UDP-glucose 4-epimerase